LTYTVYALSQQLNSVSQTIHRVVTRNDCTRYSLSLMIISLPSPTHNKSTYRPLIRLIAPLRLQ